MTLGFLIILFGLAPKARAAIVGGTVDTTGTVTGITGATYYNVSNWQDMIDTYKGVTPNAASSNTVFLNVTANVPGNSILNSGNTVSSGKSLSINGNNYTLYLDNDTNYTTAQSIGGSDGTARAFGSNGTISTDTTLTVKNATIVNNITSGIFQMKGLNAKATAVYENVTVSNGDAIYGAQPIRNDNGKVLFRGTNTFNILQNHNINDTSSAGADNQGEWIQGGAYLEVVTGTTTLNQSWGNDQPFYVYYSSGGSTLQVDAGAAMVWNLNKTYTMYYDDGSLLTVGALNWNINGSFVINGTVNTSSLSSMNRTFNVSLDPTLTQGTPVDGSWSSLINGASTETLVVGDDRAQNPNIHVLVKMTQNNFPNGLQYYWVDPTTKTTSQLILNSALQIASITSDSTLPSWIKMTGAGSWYTLTFPTDSGLNIKANNSLLTQTNTNAGTFQYTVANGPS